MVLLLLFAFVAGIVTVLSPCVLPILPIILSSSVDGGKQRPLGVILGFVLSFTFFTLFLSSLVRLLGLSAEVLRVGAMLVIFTFGVALVLPWFQKKLEQLFSRLSQLAPTGQNQHGLLGGVVVGLSLGLLWTPCVGPILAGVISLALTGTVTTTAALITLAYAIGTSLPMFAIMIGGRALLNRVPWLVQNTQSIQKAFGVVMMVTAVAILLNWDRQFQTWVLTTFPQYGTGLTQIENHELVQDQLDILHGEGQSVILETGQPMFEMTTPDQLPRLYQAPELQPSGQWFNSEPLTLSQLRGKVVLLDFWTYSCINCIRTLPYLKQWHEKYADQGLVILGAHAPEFEFEKSAANLSKAITDFGLEYPIFQDNDFLTWRAYNNRYWPAKYLIDQEGVVRYSHFGEGDYDETENAIRQLLGDQPLTPADDLTAQTRVRQTPETYLGLDRAQAYVHTRLQPNVVNTLEAPNTLPPDGVALSGAWFLADEYIESRSPSATLALNFSGREVYLVMELAEDVTSAQVEVRLDGQVLSSEFLTADHQEGGMIAVSEARKYDVLQLPSEAATERHVLQLVFDPGVRAFAFTFGG